MAKPRSVRGRKTAKASSNGGTPEKRSFVENRRGKAESKAKMAPSLTADQITVVGIQLDMPGHGRMSLRPGRAGNHWDSDLTDNKADHDPTDQFFDMDNGDLINDMDPCDPLRRGRGGGPIIA